MSLPVHVPIGARFNRWTVIDQAPCHPYGVRRVVCRCECGTVKTVRLHNIRRGLSRSCGCFSHEAILARNHKHGGAYTLLYKTWAGIRSRCSTKGSSGWKYYGARGIRMYPEWRESFKAFRDYVLSNIGERPSTSHSIDRIDNDGHYEPGNIRWATWSQQARNKRRRVA